MKTEGLTFLEAVKSVRDGKCEGMTRNWKSFYFVPCAGAYKWVGGPLLPRDNDLGFNDFLASDWQLVNPKPKMEEVREKRWMWLNGEIAKTSDYEPYGGDIGQWVEVIYLKEAEDE